MDEIFEMRAVAPVRPAAPYIGGKRQLSKRLCEIIAATPHSIYAEAFVGMGGVFFRRAEAPQTEVINDRSQDVAIFFRILQRHYQAFMDMLKWQLTSRAEFERISAQNADSLTDLERAARFLYLQRLSFGGKVRSRVFGISTTGGARFDTAKLGIVLEGIHDRLTGVTIECLDWREFLRRWDRPGTLFYLDPPYWGHGELLSAGAILEGRSRGARAGFEGASRTVHPDDDRLPGCQGVLLGLSHRDGGVVLYGGRRLPGG